MQPSLESYDSLTLKFTKNTQFIEEILGSFEENDFFRKPVNGGWCAAEITEHLLISDRTGLFAMVRRTLPTDRNPLAITELLDERRQQGDVKFQAPDAAMPKGVFKTRDEAINTWKNNRLNVLQKVTEENLWLLAGGFEHPKLGMLTVAEWMLFMCWHSEHHLPQLRACAGL
jgi:hypothetical protein